MRRQQLRKLISRARKRVRDEDERLTVERWVQLIEARGTKKVWPRAYRELREIATRYRERKFAEAYRAAEKRNWDSLYDLVKILAGV